MLSLAGTRTAPAASVEPSENSSNWEYQGFGALLAGTLANAGQKQFQAGLSHRKETLLELQAVKLQTPCVLWSLLH